MYMFEFILFYFFKIAFVVLESKFLAQLPDWGQHMKKYFFMKWPSLDSWFYWLFKWTKRTSCHGNLSLHYQNKLCADWFMMIFFLQGVADRVCLGLLPSSEASWLIAVRALRCFMLMLLLVLHFKCTVILMMVQKMQEWGWNITRAWECEGHKWGIVD